MFEQSTLPNGRAGLRLWGAFAGVGGQVFIVLGMVVAPLVWPQALPTATLLIPLVAPGPPPPPPPAPPPGEAVVRPRLRRAFSQIVAGALVAPILIPKQPAILEDAPPESGVPGVAGGVAGGDPERGVPGGILSDILQSRPRPLSPPPPVETQRTKAPQTAPRPVQRIRVSDLQQAEPVFRPDPVYPPIARQARISGVVQLIGVIGVDGRMKELRVISGHPFLAHAALQAVQRWIYKPTLLNGEPVEVEAPIAVTFRLN